MQDSLRRLIVGAGGIVLCLAVGMAKSAGPLAAPAARGDSGKFIQSTLKMVKSAANPLETRKTAAGMLLDLGTCEAQDALLKILTDPADKQARLAVVEALADQEEPPASFTQPLIDVLLSGESDIQTAASSALARFRGDKLMDRLIRIAMDPRQPVAKRLPVIETLGKMRSKTTVEALIRLMASPGSGGERAEIETACAKSLKELTRADLGVNVEAWKGWWEKNKAKSVPQWLESQLDVVINENRDLKKRLDLTEEALIQASAKLFRYTAANDADRIKIIQDDLAAALPAQRRAGLELVTSFIAPKQPVPAALRPAIRDLVDDPDSEVRRACAKVLGESGDHEAVEQILQQLDVETDPAAKQAMLVAVGQLGDKDLLEKLIPLLNSGVESTSIGAAGAITRIFQGQKNITTGQREDVVQALLKRYDQLTAEQGPWKQELLAAMSTIGDYRFINLFKQELASASADLRLYAVRGLAKLGDEKLVDLLLDQLNKDPEPAIRVELANAIASLTSDARAVDFLMARTNPNLEKDNQVQQSTFKAVLTMIKHWTIDVQLRWADRLTLRTDPISSEQMAALCLVLGNQIMEQSAAWPPEQKYQIMLGFGKFLLKTTQAAESVKYFRQAVSASKQLSSEKAQENADQLLTMLFAAPASDVVIAQYLNSLVGLLEQDQLETIIGHFLQWAEHPPNTRTAARICRNLSKELLTGVSDAAGTKLSQLAKTYVPETKPESNPTATSPQ